MIVAGNGIYETCRDCGKLVKMNGWHGGWHICCLTEEERTAKRMQEATMRGQVERQRRA